ncbi:hypothetical protein ACFFMN_14290 [Planobispora siamensis]|uniref:t-SNARE coiled-coil homology domain-containing protein n=1 Tax=Planobispora siamensis TaxID=936338 RepID=A0A8J3WHH7_9ACTN|nr:hypothetical protein [Planobispora siamensis]GIH89465.1 hypothetical protein Psi01_00950 [Planobispora siamensis]
MDHSNHTALLQAGSPSVIPDRMRELLARAAQDHVYEQRTQGAVLDEIRQRLEGMEWLLREVRERELGGLNGTLESVHGRLDDIAIRPPSWAESLAQHVEVVRDHVDTVDVHVGSVGQGVGDRMDELDKRLGQLQASMEAASGRFTRLDKALTELSERAEGLENGLSALPADVQDIVDATAVRMLAAVDQVMAKADLTVTRMDDRIDGIESRIDRVDGHLIGVNTRLTSIDGRIETTDCCLADIDTRMSELETHIGSVDTHLGSVDTHLGSVDANLGTATARLDSVDNHLGSMDSHLGSVDTRLSSVDTRLGSADTRAGDVATRHDGRFDTLDERLDDIEGRITGRIDVVDSRLSALHGHAEKTGEQLEAVDDHIEAVNQRIGQLPATLNIGDVHRNIGELISAQTDGQTERFDTLEDRLAQAEAALAPLADMLRAQPDREQLVEALGEIVEPARTDLTRRLNALEETMLALAEALLRPTRSKD